MNKFENGGDEISSDFPLFLGLSGKGKKKIYRVAFDSHLVRICLCERGPERG